MTWGSRAAGEVVPRLSYATILIPSSRAFAFHRRPWAQRHLISGAAKCALSNNLTQSTALHSCCTYGTNQSPCLSLAGGFKLWECSVDLCQLLLQRYMPQGVPPGQLTAAADLASSLQVRGRGREGCWIRISAGIQQPCGSQDAVSSPVLSPLLLITRRGLSKYPTHPQPSLTRPQTNSLVATLAMPVLLFPRPVFLLAAAFQQRTTAHGTPRRPAGQEGSGAGLRARAAGHRVADAGGGRALPGERCSRRAFLQRDRNGTQAAAAGVGVG